MTTFKESKRIRSKTVARSNVKQKFRPKVSKGEALLENHLNALKIPFTREWLPTWHGIIKLSFELSKIY